MERQKDELRAVFQKYHDDLCLSRAKIALIIGIVVVPFFSGLDYVLARQFFAGFLTARLITVLEAAIMLGVIFYSKRIGLRFSSFFVSFYCVTLGIVLTYMCIKLGGFNSTYYVGIIIVILGATVVMPWYPAYHLFSAGGMYLAYLSQIFFVGVNSPWGTFINNNYFLFSAVTMTFVGSILHYRMHYLLKEKDQHKSSFLATISHELKTPMTLIATPLEQAMAVKKGGKVELDEVQAESVRRNVYRLSSLVGDLVELARGEVGKSEIIPSEIPDVKRHFTGLFEGMKPLFEEKGIQVLFQCDNDPKPHFFDVKKIDKVFYNLLGNALKFTPKGGKVAVRIWDISPHPPLNIRGGEGGILNLSVTDTGTGIPPDKIGRIFERFVQVEEGATRSYEGMGIGLSLVKDFVEQHGGTVSVESEVGRGSKFTVSLPRGREYFKAVMIETKGESVRVIPPFDLPHAVIPATPDSGKRSPRERTVLVVEDNPDLRASIAKILEEDYRVVSAGNGQEGLEKARETRPTLIITDIMMPVMDGYRMIREIRKEERFRDLPVIVLTAKSGEEGLAEAFETGANDYLTKPFSSLELKLRVKNQISMQVMEAEIIRQQNLASVGTLSAGISHNMNTYAATIAWGLDLVTSRLKKADLPEVLFGRLMDGLLGATVGLGSIRHMIKALRIYSQKNAEGFKESDFVENTRAVIELAKGNLPSHVELTYVGPSFVNCYYNPHILNPAIMNLINNAVDACGGKEYGKVEVSLKNGGDEVLLGVKDDGHGIPREIESRVWEPYFTTKDVGKGDGLGLWMVRNAVEMDHGGKVWFETGETGTTFYVRLPVKGGGHHGQEKNSDYRG